MRPRRKRPLLAAALALVAIGVSVAALVNPVSGTPAGTRDGEVVADGAWCWFQDPRAVHFVGQHDRTYIGYVTSTGDIDVVSEDTGSALLAHTTLHAGLQQDDHAAPGLEVLPGGQIAVFYAKHTGSQMYYRISTRAEDITSFGPEHTVGVNTAGAAGYTYANPIYLSAEKRTYLFFRGADSKPSVTWSDDGLKSWAPAKELITGPATRPYAKYATNGKDKIFITFDDGHPRDVPTNSVYALMYSGGQLSTMNGAPVGTLGGAPVDIRTVQPLYDGSGADGRAWVQDAALDPDGNPVVTFASFPTDTNHLYHYARWDGNVWQQSQFTDAGGSIDSDGREPEYSGGVTIDPNDVSTVYTSREINKEWEIQRWQATKDGGVDFGTPVDITQNSQQKNVRPVVPWGPPGEVQVLWMSGTYTYWKGGFKTQIRELTSGAAPTTTRISLSAARVVAGTKTTVSGRVVQGYQGAARAGARVQLWGHTAGRAYSLQTSATTNSAGLASFSVVPKKATVYDVRAPAGAGFGASTSPPVTVNTVIGTASRLSVTPRKVRRGQAVTVGMRIVNSGTGHGIAGAHAQLWQRVGTGAWMLRNSVPVDGGGLAHVTTRPSSGVTYQARYPGNATYGPSSSATIGVAVTP
jgi:hypothetical protein